MLKLNNDDFILYNENGDILLIGVYSHVNNIYTVCKTHALIGDDLFLAQKFIAEHFNNKVLYHYLQLDSLGDVVASLIKNFWNTTELLNVSIEEMLRIIDDGLVHNFEYKVENHILFWREK